MKFDPEVANSSGYFKDPVTKEDLSVDTPRVIQCSFENGKFVWPCVASSDGTEVLKIVYKYFTDEEKALYKAYRGRGNSTSERKPRSSSSKPKEQKQEHVKEREQVLVKFDEQAAVSEKTQEIIRKCDEYLGVIQTQGLTYSLLSIKGTRCVYSVPLSAISQEDMLRLCQ